MPTTTQTALTPPDYVGKVEDNLDQAGDQLTNEIGALSPPLVSTEYKAPTATDLNNTGLSVKDASKYFTPETTVAGQLSKLLSEQSPYMKQVDAKSKLQANELGMLSSDRYIGAATGAAIRESLPIATADASTAARFGLQQQSAENQLANVSMEGLVSGSLAKQKGALDQKLATTQGQINAALAKFGATADIEKVKVASQLESQAQIALANLNNKFQLEYLDKTVAADMKKMALQSASTQITNTTIAIENMLKDPDILQLGSEAVADLINNQISLMTSGINLSYNLAGVPIDSYVSDLMDGFGDMYEQPAFDEAGYIQAKTNQLNQSAYQGRTDWTTSSTLDAIKKAGYTPETHYKEWGKAEGITW